MKKVDPKKSTTAVTKADVPTSTDKEKEKAAVTDSKPENEAKVEPQQAPTPQTPKTSSWRKHEERMVEKQQQERQRQLLRQQQEVYGYTPFKGKIMHFYGIRANIIF